MPIAIDSSSLREGLRFLWFASELGIEGNREVDVSRVIRLCRDRAGISSFTPNPILGIDFLVATGLAERDRDRVKLTQVGVSVSSSCREPLVLNDAQRRLILEHLATEKVWSWRLRNVLTRFRADESGRLIYVRSQQEMGEEELETLTLLQLIEVIVLDKEDLILPRDSVKTLADYMYSWLPISQSELDEIIAERKRLADMAEEYVVDWEKRRLRSVGASHLCNLVTRVSSSDVSRGYDIHSVDGEHGSDLDRYIEVKSSVGEDVIFYWTSREMEVAQQYRENYWIYFVPRVDKISDVGSVLMIQDPIRFKDTVFDVGIASVLVKGQKLLDKPHSIVNYGLMTQGVAWTSISVNQSCAPVPPEKKNEGDGGSA